MKDEYDFKNAQRNPYIDKHVQREVDRVMRKYDAIGYLVIAACVVSMALAYWWLA